MRLSPQDIGKLIEWLGAKGTRVGLEESALSAAELREVLLALGGDAPPKSRRSDLITEIVNGATKTLHKTIDEMMQMSADELLRYFEEARPSRAELIKLLGELDFHPGSEGQKSLYRYAARQISETGLFQRVARNGNR